MAAQKIYPKPAVLYLLHGHFKAILGSLSTIVTSMSVSMFQEQKINTDTEHKCPVLLNSLEFKEKSSYSYE